MPITDEGFGLARVTSRIRALMLAPWVAGVGAACFDSPAAPAERECRLVVSRIVRQEVAATAGNPPTDLAAFEVVQHFSRWDGDTECLLKHEYDRHSWVTVTITSLADVTVSFDYTITYSITGDIQRAVSGSVGALEPGAVLEAQPLCPVDGGCGTPPYDPLSVEVRNIVYGSLERLGEPNS